MATGEKHSLGTLYVNNRPMQNPKNPSTSSTTEVGSVPQYSTGTIAIRNTSQNEEYKIKWIEVVYNSKILLISDRCILAKMSWDRLNELAFVEGKELTIDNRKYFLRLIEGGSSPRDEGNLYAGALPFTNEWDKIICNENNYANLPKKNASIEDEHNKLWNWFGLRTFCQEEYEGTQTGITVRGKEHPQNVTSRAKDLKLEDVGWRPVLEVRYSRPQLEKTFNLGNIFKPPIVTTKATADNTTIKIIIKIDNENFKTIEEHNTSQEISIDLSPCWDSLEFGEHAIKIVAIDGVLSSAEQQIIFKKIAEPPAKPTITSPKKGTRIKENSYINFLVSQTSTKANQTVKIKMADDSAFSNNVKYFDIGMQKNIEGVWTDCNNSIADADTTLEYRIPIQAEKNKTIYIRVVTVDTESNLMAFSDIQQYQIGDVLEFETLPQEIKYKPYSINIIDNKIVDPKADINIYVCNNANDDEKVWEDATIEYKENQSYVFKNENKTSLNWAISVKYVINANDAIDEISVTSVGIGVI